MRKGPAITLKKSTDGVDYSFPYYDNYTLSAQQSTKAPVERAYKSLTNAVISGVDTQSSTVAVGLSLFQEFSDLLGLKLGNKKFYSLAWDGGSQARFTLKIKLHRGWRGDWNAKTEVNDRLKKVMRATVPTENGLFLKAPMPSPISVFGDYTSQLISDATTNFADLASKIPLVGGAVRGGITALGSGLSGGINDLTTAIAQELGTGGTWQLLVGYYDGINSDVRPFFSISQCIVENSSLTFSKEVEKGADGKYYPISGELSLEMKSQGIITNNNIPD